MDAGLNAAGFSCASAEKLREAPGYHVPEGDLIIGLQVLL
jgi:hypothetical protein